ncbi:MAG: hypothetical protein QM831_37415 [Kofleriaceae bacterium]
MTDLELALIRSYDHSTQSFDRGTLSIFADTLSASGDPRGELIQLELEGNPHTARRRSLEREWLGDVPESIEVRPWCGFIDIHIDNFQHRSRHGVSPIPVTQAFLGSKYRRVIRELTVRGNHALISAALAAICDGPPMPFLDRIRFMSTDGDNNHRAGVAGAAFIAATPHLRSLLLQGVATYEAIQHPAVERLVIRGAHALFQPSVWDRVTRLIYDIEPLPSTDYSTQSIINLFQTMQFPALVHLDLDNNNDHLPRDYDIFELLAGVDLSPTVEDVRMPRRWRHLQAGWLATARARHPHAIIREV